MSYVQKEGQGSLFRNDKSGNESRPDYRGSITVNGVEYELAAWIKEGNKGKFMSISAKPKQDRPQQESRRQPPKPASGFDDMDDDIPF